MVGAEMNNSIVKKKVINYYASFYEVSKELNQKQFYEFNTAIFSVMFYEKHIDDINFDDRLLSIAWLSVKHSLQASIDGFCSKNQIDYDTTLSKGVGKGLTNNVNDKDNDNVKEKEKGKVRTSRSFVKPSIKEITDYCLERKNSIDAESFFHFYEGKNWFVGKNKMVSWKSAIITWEKRDNNNNDNEGISYI